MASVSLAVRRRCVRPARARLPAHGPRRPPPSRADQPGDRRCRHLGRRGRRVRLPADRAAVRGGGAPRTGVPRHCRRLCRRDRPRRAGDPAERDRVRAAGVHLDRGERPELVRRVRSARLLRGDAARVPGADGRPRGRPGVLRERHRDPAGPPAAHRVAQRAAARRAGTRERNAELGAGRHRAPAGGGGAATVAEGFVGPQVGHRPVGHRGHDRPAGPHHVRQRPVLSHLPLQAGGAAGAGPPDCQLRLSLEGVHQDAVEDDLQWRDLAGRVAESGEGRDDLLGGHHDRAVPGRFGPALPVHGHPVRHHRPEAAGAGPARERGAVPVDGRVGAHDDLG